MNWVTDWLTDWFNEWLSNRLIDWLINWLIYGWLIDWLNKVYYLSHNKKLTQKLTIHCTLWSFKQQLPLKMWAQNVDPRFIRRGGGGSLTPGEGVKSYYFTRFLLNTAWKWNKLDWGGRTSLAPHHLDPPMLLCNFYCFTVNVFVLGASGCTTSCTR